MAENKIKTRIQLKHDTEAHWEQATNFKPLLGELIIYDKDDSYSYERFKIGDGVTLINDLPFALNPRLPYGICSTSGSTAAKTVTVDNFVLEDGARVIVKFASSNNKAKPTLNVNNTGAKAMYRYRSSVAVGDLRANVPYEFVYDAADDVWHLINAEYKHPTHSWFTGVPTADATLKHGGTFTVTQPVSDSLGHITAMNTRTYTLPELPEIPVDTNQKVKVGDTTFDVNDAIDFVAGTNIAITGDSTNDTITIATTGLATVATSGNYNDLINKPTSMTPTAHTHASNDVNAMTGYSKPATTSAIADTDTLNIAIGKLEKALDSKQANGSYSTTGHKHTKSEITDFPTIPTVNNGTLTIQKNGTNVTTFSANQSSSATANITVPTKTSELTNDSGFKTTDTNTTYDLSASTGSSNGNVKLNLTAGGSGSGTDSVTIKGSGATTVTTDANGVVTISSTDENTVYSHPSSGVAAGTYKSVTVNAQGHVTGGSNPTTLAGYGITDAIPSSQKATANGVATLNEFGKVPTDQLPSYVDDVLEYSEQSSFPTTGETGKIYVNTTTNKTYRWSGSAYVEISASLALGETSSTAYRGDRGKVAYDHSQATHAPSNAQPNQNAFSNIKVGAATVAADTPTDSVEFVGNNVTITPDATNDKITFTLTKDNVTSALGYTPPTADTNTWRKVQLNGTDKLGTGTNSKPLNLKAGTNISITEADGTFTFSATDTDTKYTHPTYTAVTSKPTADQTPAFGGTATVSQITSDTTGHVTGATDRTITIPSTLANKNTTAGLIKTSSTVSSSSGYTACPVLNGVPYYKDTNTNTKVTSAENHYTPASDASSNLSVDASASASATWGTTSLVTGVNLQRDSKGHVTGLTVDSVKMPANPDTTVTVDSQLSSTSTNPVQNSIVTTALNDKISKSSTVVQSIEGGLIVGGTTATAAGKGRIMVTGNNNPLIGVQAVDSDGTKKTPYYFQVANDILYLGPTSTKALAFDKDGKISTPETLSVAKDISENGKTLSATYLKQTDVAAAVANEFSKLITCGTADPSSTTTSMYYFKYSI